MQTQPEKKMGPGALTPEPRCIAYLANALPPYALQVIEGNRNAVSLVIERSGAFCCALMIQGCQRAEAPENAL